MTAWLAAREASASGRALTALRVGSGDPEYDLVTALLGAGRGGWDLGGDQGSDVIDGGDGYDIAAYGFENHTGGSPFFVAERYSIADIALYAYTHCAPEGGFDLAGYPAVSAWLERVKAQPRHVPMPG